VYSGTELPTSQRNLLLQWNGKLFAYSRLSVFPLLLQPVIICSNHYTSGKWPFKGPTFSPLVLVFHSLYPHHIPQSAHSSTMKMEAAGSSKTLVNGCQTTRHHINTTQKWDHWSCLLAAFSISAESCLIRSTPIFGLLVVDKFYLPTFTVTVSTIKHR
jgi:hypothetical protein